MHTETPVPSRDPRAEKVRRFRQLYLAGRLDEVLFGKDARWDKLADAVFAGPDWSGTDRSGDEA